MVARWAPLLCVWCAPLSVCVSGADTSMVAVVVLDLSFCGRSCSRCCYAQCSCSCCCSWYCSCVCNSLGVVLVQALIWRECWWYIFLWFTPINPLKGPTAAQVDDELFYLPAKKRNLLQLFLFLLLINIAKYVILCWSKTRGPLPDTQYFEKLE